MTYLDRPIFTVEFNWAEALAKSFSFDLGALQIGFGVEKYAPRQTHVVRGYEVVLQLSTPEDVAAVENFISDLYGPLTGFWLPTDQAEMTIKAAVDATRFDIVAQELVNTWQDVPARYLYFTKEGETPLAAKITAVATIDGTTERVTVDADVAVDDTWKVSRLLYVRLAGDDEEAEFIAEQLCRRTLRVVELPLEYVDWETGERPIYLYHFWVDYPGAAQHWRFTSFAEQLTVDGNVHSPFPISHSQLVATTRLEREDVDIQSFYDADANPLALFVPFDLSLSMHVEILETTLPTLGAPTVVFSGQVESVEPTGAQLTAKCVSLLNLSQARLPRFLLQQRCNYRVYEPNTCKVNVDDFKVSTTIASIEADPTLIRVATGDLAANWFAMGWVEANSGTADFEGRSVLSSTRVDATTQELRLNRPFRRAVVGNAIICYSGCDGLKETCKTKFNNFVNFGGHWAIPASNPTVKAIETKNTGGGKK